METSYYPLNNSKFPFISPNYDPKKKCDSVCPFYILTHCYKRSIGIPGPPKELNRRKYAFSLPNLRKKYGLKLLLLHGSDFIDTAPLNKTCLYPSAFPYLDLPKKKFKKKKKSLEDVSSDADV